MYLWRTLQGCITVSGPVVLCPGRGWLPQHCLSLAHILRAPLLHPPPLSSRAIKRGPGIASPATSPFRACCCMPAWPSHSATATWRRLHRLHPCRRVEHAVSSTPPFRFHSALGEPRAGSDRRPALPLARAVGRARLLTFEVPSRATFNQCFGLVLLTRGPPLAAPSRCRCSLVVLTRGPPLAPAPHLLRVRRNLAARAPRLRCSAPFPVATLQ